MVRRISARAGANHLGLATRELGRRRARYRLTATPTAGALAGRPVVREFSVRPARR